MEEIKKYQWGTDRRFNNYSGYFSSIFGGRVQKLSIDAGFSCPNRDGTRGYNGCTFCNNDAFNPSYCISEKPVKKQIEEGIEFHKWRYKRSLSYLAYFQAFSNTYSSVDRLKELYLEALGYPGVIGLVIGTRPDCIDDEKLTLIRDISKTHYVIIEYGIESCFNKTLKRINRGHTFEDSVNALEKTASYGINTGAHFIFGLPGETIEEMLSESDIISELPLKTVKFHQLQIFKGTSIEKEYTERKNDFVLFTLNEYIEFFISFLEHLNPVLVIERFTGEAPPRFLATEGWGLKRSDEIIRLVEKRMEELNTWQGKYYKKTEVNLIR
jgi:uncharacterized protein